MAKSELNGKLKFIINHILIIGAVIAAIITVGRWLESTKGDIAFLQNCAANVENKIEPQVIDHDKRIALVEKDLTYLKTGQDEIKSGIENLDKKLDRVAGRNTQTTVAK